MVERHATGTFTRPKWLLLRFAGATLQIARWCLIDLHVLALEDGALAIAL
jgi:hypothetical protein